MQIFKTLTKNEDEEPIQQTELNILEAATKKGQLNQISQGSKGRNACGY